MAATPESIHPRLPGRPRSARADHAIREATLDCFIEDGFRGMSMDAIAARAGVGKATIYRRWKSKEELLVDSIASLNENLEPVDTGSVATDLVTLIQNVAMRKESKAGQCMQQILPQLRDNPRLGDIYKQGVIEPRRRLARGIFERGVERGELRADVDLEVAIDMVVGAVVFRKLLGDLDPMNVEDYISKVVDQAMSGLRPAG
jgi:AcrR family transcriptional regulator